MPPPLSPRQIAAGFPIPFKTVCDSSEAVRSALAGSLMLETAGTGISVIDFRAGDYQTGFNDSMQRNDTPLTAKAWVRVHELIQRAPYPGRALHRDHPSTVRRGGILQARVAPLLAGFAPRFRQLAAIRRYHGLR